MPRFLMVVAPNHPRLYNHARLAFSDTDGFEVIADRRVGERRRGSGGSPATDRRRGDRRRSTRIAGDLRTLGWMLVRVNTTD
jgi:hypothetical protein